MLTLATLVELGFIRPWEPSGASMPVRSFYYSKSWRDSLERLLGGQSGGLTRSASPRARVLGFVQRFVAGDPAATLVRPRGDAMDPPFKRLRRPNAAVVYLRTSATRSFGFFSRADVFVALFLADADALKRRSEQEPDKYKEYAEKVQTLLARMSAADVDGVTDASQLVTDRR
jgi:hypothetical protein